MLSNTTSYGYTGSSLLPNSVQLPTPGRPAIQISRNNYGQPLTITDPTLLGASPTKVSYYPSTNLPQQVLDGAQRPTKFYYTSKNNLQTLRRQLNSANVDVNYGYDGNDNLTSIQDPLTHSWNIGRDNLGRVTSVQDPTGVTASCHYDQFGNVDTVTVPGVTIPGFSVSMKYAYDALHRISTVTSPTGTTTYNYDPVNQWLNSTTQKDNQGNVLQSVSYAHNTNAQVTGQTSTLTQPGNNNPTLITTTYGYNSFGSVNSVTPSGAQPINFNYNAAGQLLGTSETDSGPAVGPAIIASNASSGVWTNVKNQTMSWGAPQSSLPVTGYSYAKDGSAGTVVNTTGASLAWNSISDGQHIFAMRAVDSAGNWSPQSTFNLWVDSTPPTVSIVSVTPNPIPQGSQTVTITANITDSGSGLAGTPQISWCVSSDTSRPWSAYTPMTPGSGNQWVNSFVEPGTGETLYYQIQAQDAAGNTQNFTGETSIANNGPIGYWEFEEGMGTATADSSENGNNGTLVNSPTWGAGVFGGALSFNGTSSYVNLNNTSITNSLKPALPVTVSAWIKPASATGVQTVFASDNFSSVYYGFDMKLVGGVLSCDYGSGTSAGSPYRRSKNGTTVLTAGVWYHVAVVIQGPTSMNLYVNGVDNGGTYNGSGGPMQYSTASSKIGSEGTNYFNGVIDDVRVYNRALGTTEIGLLANGPTSNWRFDEGTGTTAFDSGTSAITGTLVNGPVYTQGWFDDALNFNGTNSYVNLNNTSITSLLKPALPVTVSAWIKTASTSGYQTIFASDNWNTAYYGYDMKLVAGVLSCDYGSGPSAGSAFRRSKNGTTVLTPGLWYHVCAVIQGPTSMNLYVNGVDDGGTYNGTGGAMQYSTTPSKIGSEGTNYFHGLIDDVRVYSRALSPTEVQVLNSANTGPVPPE